MKIICEVEAVPAENPERICEGCFFRVGIFGCFNRQLCPSTDSEKLNFKQKTRFEEFKEAENQTQAEMKNNKENSALNKPTVSGDLISEAIFYDKHLQRLYAKC
jgi:hypothetical protein